MRFGELGRTTKATAAWAYATEKRTEFGLPALHLMIRSSTCVCVCVCLQVLGTICTCAERVQNWVYNYSVRLPPMAVWALHVVSSRLRCIYFPEYTKTKRISNISPKCTCLHGVCVFATVHLPYIFVKFHCQKRRLDINWPHVFERISLVRPLKRTSRYKWLVQR